MTTAQELKKVIQGLGLTVRGPDTFIGYQEWVPPSVPFQSQARWSKVHCCRMEISGAHEDLGSILDNYAVPGTVVIELDLKKS